MYVEGTWTRTTDITWIDYLINWEKKFLAVLTSEMASAPRVPNGIANKPSVELTSIPPVVGINFGNSYASIAVLAKVGVFLFMLCSRGWFWPETQEGQTECIANEDGERQIACAISFQGEEMVSFVVAHPMDSVADPSRSILATRPNTNLSEMHKIRSPVFVTL